jgi:hypothetical protein
MMKDKPKKNILPTSVKAIAHAVKAIAIAWMTARIAIT